MNSTDIYSVTSYGASQTAMNLIERLGPEVVKAVRLNTTVTMPDLEKPSDEWPVIFECRSQQEDPEDFEIRICRLTSGYSCYPEINPLDLVMLLRVAEFRFDEKRIYEECPIQEKWVK